MPCQLTIRLEHQPLKVCEALVEICVMLLAQVGLSGGALLKRLGDDRMVDGGLLHRLCDDFSLLFLVHLFVQQLVKLILILEDALNVLLDFVLCDRQHFLLLIFEA